MMEGPCADSEEKHEPVSGVDIAVAVSLKVLDLDGRLEKRTSTRARGLSANDPYRSSTPPAVNLRNPWPAPRIMRKVVRGPNAARPVPSAWQMPPGADRALPRYRSQVSSKVLNCP